MPGELTDPDDAPIATQTRVPPRDRSAEDPTDAPIVTGTRAP